MKLTYIVPLILFSLVACGPSKPEIKYAGENSIEIVYSAYDIKPTVTAEAIDIAAKHCEKNGKGFKYVSGSAYNVMTSTKEIHTFMCTNDLVDERIEVNIKN
jgi:hypothetical protein